MDLRILIVAISCLSLVAEAEAAKPRRPREQRPAIQNKRQRPPRQPHPRNHRVHKTQNRFGGVSANPPTSPILIPTPPTILEDPRLHGPTGISFDTFDTVENNHGVELAEPGAHITLHWNGIQSPLFMPQAFNGLSIDFPQLQIVRQDVSANTAVITAGLHDRVLVSGLDLAAVTFRSGFADRTGEASSATTVQTSNHSASPAGNVLTSSGTLSVGYAFNSDPLIPYTTFLGHDVAPSDLVLRVTKYPDFNYDGQVSNNDITALSGFYASTARLIPASFLPPSIPEPTSIAFLCLASSALATRRRRSA